MKTLREVRENKGVKQLAVANYPGISRQTYAAYEQNQEQMSIEQARAAREFLGCKVADIFASRGQLDKYFGGPVEDKEGFARALSAALVEFDGGRYDWLRERPLAYSSRGGEEFVRIDGVRVCVTGDSLRALMRDVASSDAL